MLAFAGMASALVRWEFMWSGRRFLGTDSFFVKDVCELYKLIAAC